MEVKLVVVGGVHAGKVIPVRRAKYVIGRSKECQLRPGCNLVSRRHCVILLQEGHLLVEDLRSTNGTVVNGEKIDAPHELNHGDHLHVGTMEFEVRMFEDVEKEPESETPDEEEEEISAGSTIPASRVDAEPKNDFPEDESEWELAGLDEAAGEVGRATKEEKKPAKGDVDELDISNWFGDESGNASSDGDSDAASTSDSRLPDTGTMPQSPDMELKKNGSGKKGPTIKTVDPPQQPKPTAKKKDCSQTAATDVLDMMNRFVPKKR